MVPGGCLLIEEGSSWWMSTDIRGKLVDSGGCLLIEDVDGGYLLT